MLTINGSTMLTINGSTAFILNEVEGLTTCGSMSLTINRTSKVRDSACGERSRTTGSLTNEYKSLLR